MVKFVWVCLLLNVILTLGSMLLTYILAKQSKSYQNKSLEDAINIKIAIVNALVELAGKAVGFSILALMLYPVSMLMPYKIQWSLTNFLLCFILTDLFYYFSHLSDHKIQFFWNQHCVHHSSNSFSLSTGYRKSWIAFAVNWIFYLPIGFLGFPPEMIILSLALITSYTHLLHTEYFSSFPYVEYIFNTPKAHRIHHSAHENHIDKNMAGVFMIWDQIFKTFSLSSPDKVVYGLTKPLAKKDPIYVNFQEWFWVKNVLRKKGFKKTLTVLMRSPDSNKALHTEII